MSACLQNLSNRCISHCPPAIKAEIKVSYLENDLVGTKGNGNVILVLIVCDQLVRRRHINAVDIGVSDSRGARRKVNLLGTSITSHLHNLLGGRTTNNGV